MIGFIKKMTKKKLCVDDEDEIDYEHINQRGPFSLPKNEIFRCQILGDQDLIFTPYY